MRHTCLCCAVQLSSHRAANEDLKNEKAMSMLRFAKEMATATAAAARLLDLRPCLAPCLAYSHPSLPPSLRPSFRPSVPSFLAPLTP